MRRVLCWFTGHHWQERERTFDETASGYQSGGYLGGFHWTGRLAILFCCTKCGAFTVRGLYGKSTKDALERMIR